jgi:hypothetical protein
MTRRSIVLLGGPDSGKTNYVGRLWPSFKKRRGVLRAERLPDDIEYVDRAVEHLMQGSFAPRSDRNLEVGRADFSISVRDANGEGAPTELMVPDISGELWTRTVATSEISQEWLDVLNEAEGAVLFVRAHSDQNVKPLDWVTARNILRLDAKDDEPSPKRRPEAAANPWSRPTRRRPKPDSRLRAAGTVTRSSCYRSPICRRRCCSASSSVISTCIWRTAWTVAALTSPSLWPPGTCSTPASGPLDR